MKSLEISKELLSDVLGLKVWKVLGNTETILQYCIYPNKEDEPSEYMFPINIYELAYKCKEWAFKQGYELRSGRDIDVKEEYCYFCEYKHERQLDYENGKYFLGITEPESILKTCEWILKEAEKRVKKDNK